MKPDGVSAAPEEPMAELGADSAIEPEQDVASSSPQPAETTNEQQPPEKPTAPPAVKEADSKSGEPTGEAKAPVKGKPGQPGTRANGMTAPSSRPTAAQIRLANGVQRSLASDVAKKTSAPATKKTTSSGAASLSKRPAGGSAAGISKPQAKMAEKKPVGVNRPAPVSTVTNGAKTTTGTTTLSRRLAAGPSTVAAKPKTSTAARPASATAPKPSASTAASRTAPAPKTSRPATAPTSRPAPSSATAKPAIASSRPLPASRLGTTVSSAGRSATAQASRPPSAAAAKKDVSRPLSSTATKKPPAPSSRAPTAKPTKAEPSKSASTSKPDPSTKRPPLTTTMTASKSDDPKAARPKAVESKLATNRKVPTSPRTVATRSTPSKTSTAAASPGPKQVGKTKPLAARRGPKPTQAVPPLSSEQMKEAKAAAEISTAAAAVATAAVATAAAIVTAGSLLATPVSEPEEPQRSQTSVTAQDIQGDAATLESVEAPLSVPDLRAEEVPPPEQVAEEASPEAAEALEEVPSVPSSTATQVPSLRPELMYGEAERETLATAVQEDAEHLAAVAVPPMGLGFVDRTEQESNNDYEEEEEREGSQQVSVSEMSGTQPTEESRPGSAGMAGSMWRGGALLSEMDSEDVSCSQQGASELSAPGVLEGTESMDDLGEASLKGADGDGASAGSPDFEKVPDIPVNEDEDDEDDDDDDDRVCDMEVGSERAEDPHKQRQDGEYDEEDEDVEMASEGVTESGLESYGNADEDDFAEDDKLDNLNRIQPPPIFPSAPPAAQWGQATPFADPWAQPPQPASALLSSPSSDHWLADSETPTQSPAQAWLEIGSSEGGSSSSPHPPAVMKPSSPSPPNPTAAPASEDPSAGRLGLPTARGMSQSSTLSGTELAAHSSSDTSTPEELRELNSPAAKCHPDGQQPPTLLPTTSSPASLPGLGIHLEHSDKAEAPETLPADEVLGGPATAPTSIPSTPSSATGDEASDTEGEMQISDPHTGINNEGFDAPSSAVHNLSAVEEREEACGEAEGSETPQSATSAASYGFDCSTSNAHSTTESAGKSPGIFSLENEEHLPEEAKDPSLLQELTLLPLEGEKRRHQEEQHYMQCGEPGGQIQEAGPKGADEALDPGLLLLPPPQPPAPEQDQEPQPPYYSAICEKTDSSAPGRNLRPARQLQEVLTIQMIMSPKPRSRQRADHVTQLPPPRLPTDLPPRNLRVQPNAQLRRLEQHQQQVLEIQQRREQRSQGLGKKEEEGERDEEKGEDEDERKREEKQKELEEQRRDLLQLQIQQQRQELRQRQQIMLWQQELDEQQTTQEQQPPKPQSALLLSPSSGLCTIYEALETDGEEEDKREGVEGMNEREEREEAEGTSHCEEEEKDNAKSWSLERDHNEGEDEDSEPEPSQSSLTSPERSQNQNQDQEQDYDQDQGSCHPAHPDSLHHSPSVSAEKSSPLELDWGKKVDIVQQLINQTLLLSGDPCSPLLLLPGGASGTLSPLETSLWPNLLPPLTPPSATITSVSSFSPEVSSNASQGEWTVVELETHH